MMQSLMKSSDHCSSMRFAIHIRLPIFDMGTSRMPEKREIEVGFYIASYLLSTCEA